jgi:aminomethyltransferase
VLRDGADIGAVTSGNFSPMLGHGIAIAFVPPDVQPGDHVEVEVRGQVLAAEVVALPFVKR